MRKKTRERGEIERISKREEGIAEENKKRDLERKDGKKKGRVRKDYKRRKGEGKERAGNKTPWF